MAAVSKCEMTVEQTRSEAKYHRILVCYLNSPDFMPKHLVSKRGVVKRKSKDPIIHDWDTFTRTVKLLEAAGPEDEFNVYETTCLSGLSFDLMDIPEINNRGIFDKIYLARWFFDMDTLCYNLKVLRLYEHMIAIDKDLRFAHNLERLTTGHTFDGALARSKEHIALLEKKWKFNRLNDDENHYSVYTFDSNRKIKGE